MYTIINHTTKAGQFQIYITHEIEVKSRGGYLISGNVQYGGEQMKFSTYTTDSGFYDSLNEMESYDQKQLALHDRLMTDEIVSQIFDRCKEVDEMEAED